MPGHGVRHRSGAICPQHSLPCFVSRPASATVSCARPWRPASVRRYLSTTFSVMFCISSSFGYSELCQAMASGIGPTLSVHNILCHVLYLVQPRLQWAVPGHGVRHRSGAICPQHSLSCFVSHPASATVSCARP